MRNMLEAGAFVASFAFIVALLFGFAAWKSPEKTQVAERSARMLSR